MIRVVLFTALACLVVLAWRPPVTLLDHAINRASEGRVRLALAEGSLWHGRGVLAISDGLGNLRPLRQIEWRVAPPGWRAALGVELSEHGQQQAQIILTSGGISLEITQLELPVRLIVSASSLPVARIGWGGKLTASSPGLDCDWSGRCFGRIDLRWEDVRLAIVPDRHLGDHAISLTTEGEHIALHVSTLRGDLRIEGNGVLGYDRPPIFRANIAGDPELVDRIPYIMNRNARPTGTPGQVEIFLP